MKYLYQLVDDGGISQSENEILLPLESIFRHEYGTYKVINYRDDDGKIVDKFSKITQVECDRIKKN